MLWRGTSRRSCQFTVRLGGEAQEKEKGGDVTMPKSECACPGFYWVCEHLCKRELPFM